MVTKPCRILAREINGGKRDGAYFRPVPQKVTPVAVSWGSHGRVARTSVSF